MRIGYILFFLNLFLEGCCVTNHQKKKTDLQKYYRAVEGEIFMMPCFHCFNWHVESMRSSTEGGGNKGSFLACGKPFIAEAKHSGNYSCFTGSVLSSGSKLLFRLQVVEKSLACIKADESIKLLEMAAGGKMSCPGLTCSNNTDVTWYKGNTVMSSEHRSLWVKGGVLCLGRVWLGDSGVFFCDRQIVEEGVTWTFRTAVNVTVIPQTKHEPPRIPAGNVTEEVEIGQPHTLSCKAHFPFELNFSPKMEWYVNNDGNMTLLDSKQNSTKAVPETVYEVIQVAIIKEVMPQHLKHTYTCIASNTFGNDSATIKLIRKLKVQWPSLVGYPVISCLLVAGLGIIIHVKWLEIELIYRSYFQNGKHDGDEKEFDVFLSYVWSPPPAEVVGGVTTSPKSPFNDEEGCLCITDLLNEEGKATQRPLEVLLPQVLEDQWGYRLCLLERDVLPGGVYTNDVVLAIKRSRMLICVVSDDYLTNTNAVFVLESGVQALLQKSALKILLIWTNKASASFIQPDPPLPTLVQRAVRVLPNLDWCSAKPPSSNFWRSLRKSMPSNRE